MNRTLLLLITALSPWTNMWTKVLADEASEKSSGDEKKVTFEEHIKPIFREHCVTCHSESDKESDLALDTYASSMAGGSSGAVIVENNSNGSRLFALLTHAERPYMPPDQDPIAKEQIALVKAWIEQGMPENSGSKIKRSNSAAAAMLSNTSAGKPDGPPPMPENLLRQPVTQTQRSAAIAAMVASPWAPLIAVGGQEQVSCYHSETGQLLGVIPFPEGEPQSLTFTRDGKHLLIGGGRHSQSGCAVLVDIASGERIAKVGDELDIVLAADISPDKKRIALSGPQKTVKVFDTFSGETLLELKKHTDWVFALRYSPDGVLLATGDRSNGLIVWEAETGRIYGELAGHKDQVRSLDFRADSNVLASASRDGTIKLWDMLESKEIKSWDAHGGGVSSVTFAQNGLLASAGQDSRIKLWNGNGELQKEFQGLEEAALEVALTGDGLSLAGGDWHGHVKLWQAADPNQVKLIAANPLSIEQRLEQSLTGLATLKAEFETVHQAATAAETAAAESLDLLNAAQRTVDISSQELAQASARDQALAAQIEQQDVKIAELATQLEAAKQLRLKTGTEFETAKTQVATLNAQAQTAADSLTAVNTAHQQQASVTAEAIKRRDELAARLAAAQAAADVAAADKAALDAKAASLKDLNAQTAAVVHTLVEQVTAAANQQIAQGAAVEKLVTEMQALVDQLTLLQLRVEEARKAREQSEKNLGLKSEQAAQLKQQLEAAEQAALDAQAQLRLFQESYGHPD